MSEQGRPFAMVTGASTGIGYELARCCARDGHDVLVAADEPGIHEVSKELIALGVQAMAVQCDLATEAGVDELCDTTHGRPVDVLMANAGRGLGGAFLDQEFAQVRRVLDTNVTGTIYLIHKVANEMRARGRGRILITGSIAGFMPGTYQAVYNATKAFLDSFAFAVRAELKGSGVSVTCLMPGATDTEFFERANMLDTRVGAGKKDDPGDVARVGYEAMKRGEGDVVTGWMNKLRSAIASVTPAEVLAEQHRKMAEPGTARQRH